MGNSSSAVLFCLLKVPGDIETVSSETNVDDFLFDFAKKKYYDRMSVASVFRTGKHTIFDGRCFGGGRVIVTGFHCLR